MPHRLYPQVAERADHYCEYCRAPELISPGRFEVEHIEPRRRGGSDDLRNLALACWPCNRRKSRATHAVDPEGDRTVLVPLFNPRRDDWTEHFSVRMTPDAVLIVGRTPTGRATAQRLGMNDPHPTRARVHWTLMRLFPP